MSCGYHLEEDTHKNTRAVITDYTIACCFPFAVGASIYVFISVFTCIADPCRTGIFDLDNIGWDQIDAMA